MINPINPISKINAVRSLFGRDSYHKCTGDGNVEWKDGHTTTEEETAQILSLIHISEPTRPY